MWVVIAAGLIYDLLGNPGAFSTVAIVIAIHSAASLGHRWTAITGIAASLGVSYLGDLMFDTGHVLNFEGVLWFGGWLTAGLLMGEVSRDRVARAAAIEQRARDAERHRREETLRRAGEERMRIAREVHDVLAHSISIINVQAGVAAHHFDTDPDKARAALDNVRNAGRDALRELRASLGVLRDSDADSEAPREPSPGIRDVDDLIAGVEETGLTVHLERIGDPEAVPADVGLAVYRVIQESLTNVSRHARASSVRVTIDRRPREVLVRVEDNGVGFGGATPDGHGIVGMRERLRLLGGHLDVGPAENGGGLVVEGHIPLGEGR
jgi:signal transduction histidine kinase